MEYMSFFDAASPIVVGESINFEIAFLASRYDRGEAAYLNCPLSKEQYLTFWKELCQAEQAELKDFERETAKFFEGCLPIEEMAKRGEDTMRYGPLKPVGLFDSRLGDFSAPENRAKRPYAVVQLRQEDRAGQLWNMVGFQTNLRWGEQNFCFPRCNSNSDLPCWRRGNSLVRKAIRRRRRAVGWLAPMQPVWRSAVLP
jgi:methylenetetrahydrofolate--tRNA-(uracil-5-)-methyltransferase